MKINGNESTYSLQYVQRAAAEKPAEKVSPEDAAEKRNRDEYIPSEKETPIGLYEPASDEDGSPSLKFDRPEDGKDDEKKAKSEKCTCNTDKVDREIKRLKEKAEQLEQRLRASEGEKAAALEQELAKVQTELSQKDNDGYRRSQAEFS